MDYYADTVYVHAKIHALKSRLLSERDYLGIIQSRKILQFFPHLPPPPEPVDYLKVREILFRDQIKSIIRLTASSRFYNGLFRAFLSIYEIINIKRVLLGLYGRKPLVEQWYDISPLEIMDRSLLRGEVTAVDFSELLSGTVYGGIMDPDKEQDYETLESALDVRLFRLFIDASGGFSREWENQFLEVMIKKMTMLRIVWEQRFRGFYGWDDARIREYLRMFNLPRKRFPGADAMAREAEEDLWKELQRGSDSREIGDISDLELKLERMFCLFMHRIFHISFHSLYPVISFLWLLYYQIRNLFIIAEGFRYNLPSECIQGEIVCGV